jgi:hypothetical protein
MKNFIITALTLLALIPGMVNAQGNIELQKIEFLISSIEHLDGVKFVRNGSEYNGKEAADHLRMKLQKAGAKVRTADDFISLCASSSYFSGNPYMIKFPDGNTKKSEDYFREKLKEYPTAR